MTKTDLDSIVQSNWRGDHIQWFRFLADAGYIGIDWPPDAWPRNQQLQFLKALIKCRCPLMPWTITLIAPVILNARNDSNDPRHDRMLALIRQDPLTDRIRLSEEDDHLILCFESETMTVGKPGNAFNLLAQSYSVFSVMQELLLGIEYCKGMLEHWQQLNDPTLTEIIVRADGLAALFLQDRLIADRQIALAANNIRSDVYWLLNGYLGYYALLDPDPLLADNEPVPFADERAYLKSVRNSVVRDERLQRDQLLEKVIDG